MIDFSQSYFTWHTHEGSYGRFNVESICAIYDINDRLIDTIYGLNGVMACKVYGDSPLFHDPSFFYQAVFSDKSIKIFRSFIPYQEKDSIHQIDSLFTNVERHIHPLKEEELILISEAEEVDLPLARNKAFVCQIRFNNDQFKFDLRFKVKHINYSRRKKAFQVETGPVSVVDFDQNDERWIDNSTQAYVSFNVFSELDFLFNAIERLNKKEKIRHFCKRKHKEGNIRLWAY